MDPRQLPVKYTNVGSLTLTDARVVDDVPLGDDVRLGRQRWQLRGGWRLWARHGHLAGAEPGRWRQRDSYLQGGGRQSDESGEFDVFNSAAVQPTQVADAAESNRTQPVQPDAAPDPAAAAESNPDTAPTATSTPLPRQPRRWACPGPTLTSVPIDQGGVVVEAPPPAQIPLPESSGGGPF